MCSSTVRLEGRGEGGGEGAQSPPLNSMPGKQPSPFTRIPVKQDIELRAHTQRLSNEVHLRSDVIPVHMGSARGWLKETC